MEKLAGSMDKLMPVVAALFAALLSLSSLISLLVTQRSRELIFGGYSTKVSPYAMFAFLCDLVAMICGFAALYYSGKKSDKVGAMWANGIGLLASIFTFVYFLENQRGDQRDSETAEDVMFQWGHGTGIAGAVFFMAGLALSRRKR